MRAVEDFDPSLRKEAFESFAAISDFLHKLQKNKELFLTYIPDYHTLNLDKFVPHKNHKNLLLIFEPGNGGAKFSYKENGTFTITIYIEKVFDWNNSITNNIFNWFKERRSSFIHEFVHFLDIKETDNLDQIKGVNLKNLMDYYNNPLEIRGHLQQALHEFEWDLENRYFKKDLVKKQFGKNEEEFIYKFKKLYFPYEFIKYLTKNNKDRIDQVLSNKYKELEVGLSEWLGSTTNDIVLKTLRSLLESIKKNGKG